MKQLLFIGTWLMVLFSLNKANAQTLIRNANNEVVAYVEDNKLYDLNSSPILDFTSTGVIKNVVGDVVATIYSESGEVKDVNNEVLFKLDGDVLKRTDGVQIGSVDSGGNIKDINNAILGNGDGVDEYYLAYYFLVYQNI